MALFWWLLSTRLSIVVSQAPDIILLFFFLFFFFFFWGVFSRSFAFWKKKAPTEAKYLLINFLSYLFIDLSYVLFLFLFFFLFCFVFSKQNISFDQQFLLLMIISSAFFFICWLFYVFGFCFIEGLVISFIIHPLSVSFFLSLLVSFFLSLTVSFIIILLFWAFLTPASADGFLLESEWQQVSWTLLSSLADLNHAVVWIVSTRPPYFQVLQSLYHCYDDCTKRANNHWYHRRFHGQLFFHVYKGLG